MDRKRKREDYYYNPPHLRNPFDVDVRQLVEENAELKDQLSDMLDPQLMREQIADLRQEKKRLQREVSMLDVEAGPLYMLEETIKGLQSSLAKLQSDNHKCYNELRSLKRSLGH